MEIFSSVFMQNALIAGIFSALICGISGTFVVIKKISHISGGIAHAVLGGLGIAYYVGFSPLLGAFLAAIISALVIGFVSLNAKEYEETIISTIWATGMAIGILFMHLAPGYNVDLMSLLFGNILMVSRDQLIVLGSLNVVVLLTTFLFYRQFVAIAFDEEFSKIRGLKVELFYMILLILIAISVVVLMQAIGLILIIALLTIPANIGLLFFNTPYKIMGIASVLGFFFILGGIIFSYYLNLPTSSIIILFASTSYLTVILAKKAVAKKHIKMVS